MTRAHGLTVVVIVTLLSASPAPAQQGSTQAAPPSAESLGVSLSQIRNQLKDAPALPPAPRAGLRYDFFVNVFGKRPPIQFFKDFDLSMYGPVKWGGVTHQEILNAVTPFPFQHYGMGVDMLAQFRK